MSQETKSKAQISKEKGNEAFKKGDYANAVGFYTSAMMDDPNETIYVLNRAFAYLKLGKNEDCIRDCTTALKLSPKVAKAYFRRGQAKLALNQPEDAEKDLLEAYKINSDDRDITALYFDVFGKNEIERAKKKHEQIAARIGPYIDPSGQPPRRRRVPITIVEPPRAAPSTSTPAGDDLTPVSSRRLAKGSDSLSPPPPVASPSATATTPNSQPKPSSFKEAAAARETARPSRVGGGIFKSTGAATVFPTRDATLAGKQAGPDSSVPASAAETDLKQPRPPIKAPASLFELIRQWNALKTPEDRWQLFSTIPPHKLPSLCKASVDPAFLASLFLNLSAIVTTADLNNQIQVRSYMECIPLIPRFETLWMLMSKGEKNVVWDVWRKLGVDVETKEGKDALDQGWRSLLK